MRIPLRRYLHLLARYLRPQRGLLGVLTGLLLSGVLFRLVAPLLAAAFVNQATGGSASVSVLVWLALGICAAGILDQLCVVAGTHLGAHISWTATNRLREDLVEHCLRLDLTFHHEHGPGHLVERVDGDARELANFFAEFAIKLAVNLVVIVGVLGVMLWIDWRIGLVYFAFSVLAIYLFNRVRGKASPYWRQTREASTSLYGEIEDRLGGLPDIRANGASGYVLRRFAIGLREQFRTNRRALAASIGISHGAGMVLVIGATAVLGLATALFLAGSLDIGILVALLMYTRIINRPLEEIVEQMDDLQRSTASITRIEELFATAPVVVSGPGVPLPSGALGVAFEQVSFRYPGRARQGGDADPAPYALRDVSFALRPGEVLGLVGRTGSGKSTIGRLLLRFYDPTEGRVTLGGHDLRDATLEQLRGQVGVVTQDVQLFHTTVRDNVTMFAGGVADGRLVEVLREAGLGTWYERLPDGLDTVLPPGGAGLSAGQAQLLAAARIFVAQPGLVILDEPTSRLDPETESLIQLAFERLLQGRTGVLIAHRLSTLRRADSILVVHGGAAVEYGPREALESDPGSAYHRALRLASAELASAELASTASTASVASTASTASMAHAAESGTPC